MTRNRSGKAAAHGTGLAGRTPRTVRDWAVDVLCLAAAALVGLLAAAALRTDPHTSGAVLLTDQIVGATACAALWVRRRWPVGLAVTLVAVSTVTPPSAGAMLVALFTVAVHRPFAVTAWVGGAALLSAVVSAAVRPDPDLTVAVSAITGVLMALTAIGWGVFVRSRRQLLLSLRERAQRAEAEAGLRAERAQRLARERIAREMHDVLAHRLSLLCVHAGALEFRADASPVEVARTAGVIRSSAHQALQELREVIGVLRAPTVADAGEPGRPQPTLAALEGLVEESRQAGAAVVLAQRVADPAAVPDVAGRTVYRIVQEGLTNARKHAPGSEVTVVVEGSPERGLTVEVRNPASVAVADGPTPVPGAGQGLIGLAERAALAGGRLEHGPDPGGGFRLRGWIPWRP
ncbi:histidine kinase [Streptomyces sp. SCA3-4]|uniref:sensor histidine kinase n=1 Tax=Streptomyces sichuanensis TaxID=2871810 RepID=UPI001CE2A0D9|nr:histidine kinase [Streptomyces sichuanensis]MCA6094241.1 histidine kinase [Streptomyces sichuanensis]